ncbi:MAG: ATP-dependent DNA helicase RecG [Phycisphaerales bacterium]
MVVSALDRSSCKLGRSDREGHYPARTRRARAMTHAHPIQLTTQVADIPGVNDRTAGLLRELGLTNVGKLIAHLPMRHERYETAPAISGIEPESVVSVQGTIDATRMVRAGRKPRFEAVMTDESGRLDLVWFNASYLAKKIHPGHQLRVQGKAKARAGSIQMVNPRFWIIEQDGSEHVDTNTETDAADQPELRPVYSASERIKSAQIARVIETVLDDALAQIDDHLPEVWRDERGLVPLATAYRMMHKPASEDEVGMARRRLAYDELFMLQVGVQIKRRYLRTTLVAPELAWSDEIDRRIRARLPFDLTTHQNAALRDVVADLTTTVPANRLVQGDVGSGKTVVALYAMLMAVASGHQAALMAPTSILAEQHLSSISSILTSSDVRVELLTGAVSTAERESILLRLVNGEIDILIGTHALLTEDVRFKSLALAVIDEQHRFGVEQRASLRTGSTVDTDTSHKSTPHVLVMTATPIPRTLTISLLGDLDVSTIEGLPPGRKPVETRVFPSTQRERVYEKVRERIDAGELVYVVAPTIDSTDDMGGVRDIAKWLENGPLHDVRVAVMHGQLKQATRDAVMERFRQGEIKCLVATTVIEVGVDVPQACVMVIEYGERFGLSQLHQLRGRVGRGSAASACWLIADPTTPEAHLRLDAIRTISDGFALAEKDFEIRGPGEMFGTRQSGKLPFRVADLAKDHELLRQARRDAIIWVEHSPALDKPGDALLVRRLGKMWGDTLGLVDVG